MLSPSQSAKVLLLIALFLALQTSLRLWYLTRQHARFAKIVTQQLRQASDEIQGLKQNVQELHTQKQDFQPFPKQEKPTELDNSVESEKQDDLERPTVRKDDWNYASEFITFLQTASNDNLNHAKKLQIAQNLKNPNANVVEILFNSEINLDERVRQGLQWSSQSDASEKDHMKQFLQSLKVAQVANLESTKEDNTETIVQEETLQASNDDVVPKDDLPKDDVPKDDLPKDDLPKDDTPSKKPAKKAKRVAKKADEPVLGL